MAHTLGVSALAPKPSRTATSILPMMLFSAFACATLRCRRLLPSVCVALADVLHVVVPGKSTLASRTHAFDLDAASALAGVRWMRLRGSDASHATIHDLEGGTCFTPA